MNSKPEKRKKSMMQKIMAIVKLLFLLMLLLGIPAYIYFCHHDLIERFSSIEAVEAFFARYRSQSILIYLGLQIIQIVICILPGAALQFSAGYLFHFWFGLLLTLTGAAIGTVLTYYLAGILGRDAMHLIFGEEKIQNMLEKINSKKGVIIVFLIYLIPGVPKDLCTYAAGLSEMKLKPFLILSMVGRTPAMMGSLLIGHQVQTGGYAAAAVIGGLAVVLCVLGVVFRRQITDFFDRIYGRLQRMM
ncbi:MAG: VTT domain-containing protein [Bacillota bacterium]|nr:VTT domain-containing protein [Bacillota bacterium]